MYLDKLIYLLNNEYPNAIEITLIKQELEISSNELNDLIDKAVQLELPIIENENFLKLDYPLYSVHEIQSLMQNSFQNLVLLPEVDSTNKYAKEHLSSLENQTAVLAYTQTAGVGRLQRNWQSPVGKSLSISFVLKNLPDDLNLMPFSLLAAAALTKSLEPLTTNAKIKWPNDLILNGKKITGILSEIEVDENDNKHLIVGVGLNINQSHNEFSNDIEHKATSLKLELEEWITPSPLIARFIQEFFNQAENYIQTNNSTPFIQYCKDQSAVIGKVVLSKSPRGNSTIVQVIDIDDSGRLIVKHPSSGKVETLLSHEVSIRQPNGKYI